MAAGLLDVGDVGCGRGCEFRAQGARAVVLEVIAGDGGGESERSGLLLGDTNWKSLGRAKRYVCGAMLLVTSVVCLAMRA